MADDPRALLRQLNDEHSRLHTAKEDAFWASKMGLTSDAVAARKSYDEAEIKLQRFLQDPLRLQKVRETRKAAKGLAADESVALEGWEKTFAAHAIDSAAARHLFEEIVGLEGKLASARGAMKLGYQDPQAGFVAASSVKLGAMLRSEPREELRRAAWQGLRSIEQCVLEHGFLEVVRRRNHLGRMLGAEDYYDWKVRRAEGLGKKDVFALLDELEAKTREPARNAIAALEKKSGKVPPWSFTFLTQGDVIREQDPYFPFAKALERWGRSFAAMGIDYAGARLVLDLVDRKGKHENGFMHGPEVSWREGQKRHKARIQFTANAIPGMVGAGFRATETLFHEGGHAAHFANIDMPAPCFGQEFAPTSVSFAETQSMFLDSLLEDADWQARWATNAAGEAMPQALIERATAEKQAWAALGARAMLAVCYAEKAIYELPEEKLRPETVLEVVRDVERRMVFMADGSSRPVLSVPHLLADESSAYYHGYVIAEMGVAQTRRFFQEKDGHLVDNPKIGPALRQSYWKPGNSRRASDMIKDLTGKPLSASAMAEACTRPVDKAVDEARAAVKRLASIPASKGEPELDATIKVVHGNEVVSELGKDGFGPFAARFAGWIDRLAASSK